MDAIVGSVEKPLLPIVCSILMFPVFFYLEPGAELDRRLYQTDVRLERRTLSVSMADQLGVALCSLFVMPA